jgi:hypothetical protein
MPARAALNAYYAWKVDGLDAKQRKEFDNQLYGWAAENAAAEADLFSRMNEAGSGGEG